MQDFKNLYGKEEKISAWRMIGEGLVFGLTLFMLFAFLLVLSVII